MYTTTHNRAVRTIAGIIATASVLAACGGSDDGSVSDTFGQAEVRSGDDEPADTASDTAATDDTTSPETTEAADVAEPPSEGTETAPSEDEEVATTAPPQPVDPGAYGRRIGDESVDVPAERSEWGPTSQIDSPLPGDRSAIEVGDVVSGELSLGQVDEFDFWVYPGQTLFFDAWVGDITCDSKSGETDMIWQLPELDPDSGRAFFSQKTSASTGCAAADRGPFTFEEGGQYTLQFLYESGCDCEGDYSFIIRDVPPVDRFQVEPGVVISPDTLGQGAGELESAGTRDVYEIMVEEGDFVFVDMFPEGGCGEGDRGIRLIIPTVRPDDDRAYVNDKTSASTGCAAADQGPFEIEQTGVMELTFTYDQHDSGAGSYSFQVNILDE